MMQMREVHDVVGARLRASGQRYTDKRSALVDALASSAQPVTIHQLLEELPSASQSSAYRNLAVLERAGVVHRVVTSDDFARYELAQDLTEHHHHLVCPSCGDVIDFILPEEFEVQLELTLRRAAKHHRFEPTDHRLDVIGTCRRCS
jgi:Fe2+ or Zn2+ uptake regulation protein